MTFVAHLAVGLFGAFDIRPNSKYCLQAKLREYHANHGKTMKMIPKVWRCFFFFKVRSYCRERGENCNEKARIFSLLVKVQIERSRDTPTDWVESDIKINFKSRLISCGVWNFVAPCDDNARDAHRAFLVVADFLAIVPFHSPPPCPKKYSFCTKFYQNGMTFQERRSYERVHCHPCTLVP